MKILISGLLFIYLFSISNPLFASAPRCSDIFTQNDSPSHAEVGARISNLMKQGRTLNIVRLRQTEMADLLGVTQGQISKVVNGRKPITLDNAKVISELVGLAVEVLFLPSQSSPGFWVVKGDLLKTLTRSGIEIPEGRVIRYTQGDISSIIGMSQSGFSKVLSGQRALSVENARILEDFFQVQNGWLQGSGPVVRLPQPLTSVPRTAPTRRAEVEIARKFNEAWKLEVGQRIRQLMRSDNRITQVQVAEALNVTQGYISKVLNGKEAISLVNGLILARFLQAEPDWLFAVDLIYMNHGVFQPIVPREHINFPDLIEVAQHFEAF